MKNIFKTQKTGFLYFGIVLAGIILLGVFMQSCYKEDDISSSSLEYNNDDEVSIWAESLFDGSTTEGTVYTFIGGKIEQKQSNERIPRLKSGSNNEGSEGWIAYGKVCGRLAAISFYSKMTDIYGTGCFEVKAGDEDSNGCRVMSHRPCQ
jgi:hypothetical protein